VFLTELLVQQPGREREAEQAARESLNAMEQDPAIDGGATLFGKSPARLPAELHAGFKPRIHFLLGELLTRDWQPRHARPSCSRAESRLPPKKCTE
jgi:hypothetical protein